MRVPLPDDLPFEVDLVQIGAQLGLAASSQPRSPPRRDLHILDLSLEFLGYRLVGDQQPVVVRQYAHVVDRTDPLVGPNHVAAPIVLVDRLVGTDVDQVAAGQQPAALVEIARDLPGVYHVAVHVDEANVAGNLVTLRSDPRAGVVSHRTVAAGVQHHPTPQLAPLPTTGPRSATARSLRERSNFRPFLKAREPDLPKGLNGPSSPQASRSRRKTLQELALA